MKKKLIKFATERKYCFNFRFRKDININRLILKNRTKTEYDLANRENCTNNFD
jgi:hypothetical protein